MEMGMGSRSGSRSGDPSGYMDILASYFPQQLFPTMEDDCVNLTSALFSFFSTPLALNLASRVKDDDGVFVLSIDFQQFRKVCDLEEFYIMLEDKPKAALLCMSAAIHKVLLNNLEKNMMVDGVKINIRLHNYPETMIALKNLKAAYVDKLVSVRGTVLKVSTVRPLVVQMSFHCAKCKTEITRIFPDGKFSPPQSCDLYGCKRKSFNPIRSTAQTIDFQKIRLQELLKPEDREEG